MKYKVKTGKLNSGGMNTVSRWFPTPSNTFLSGTELQVNFGVRDGEMLRFDLGLAKIDPRTYISKSSTSALCDGHYKDNSAATDNSFAAPPMPWPISGKIVRFRVRDDTFNASGPWSVVGAYYPLPRIYWFVTPNIKTVAPTYIKTSVFTKQGSQGWWSSVWINKEQFKRTTFLNEVPPGSCTGWDSRRVWQSTTGSGVTKNLNNKDNVGGVFASFTRDINIPAGWTATTNPDARSAEYSKNMIKPYFIPGKTPSWR